MAGHLVISTQSNWSIGRLFYWLVCVEQVPTIHPVIPVINHYCTTIRGSIPVSASIKPGQAAAFLRRPVLAEWFACLALDPTFGFHDRLDGFHPPARPGTSREHNPGKIGIYSMIHFCHGQPGGTALKHYKQRLLHSLVPAASTMVKWSGMSIGYTVIRSR